MKNYIFIDGIAFWVVVIFLMVVFLLFIALGSGYIKSKREIDHKNNQLKKLRREYNVLIGEYQKATFKVPSFNMENKNGRKDTKTYATR